MRMYNFTYNRVTYGENSVEKDQNVNGGYL